jgi:hypothetical protein
MQGSDIATESKPSAKAFWAIVILMVIMLASLAGSLYYLNS